MLKDCLEVFKKQYEAKGEGYILDDYVLLEGNYLLIDASGACKASLLVVDKNQEDRDEIYQLFSRMDYLSRLTDMNKALDRKKVIHSNNYLSFFIKKDNLTSGKLTDEVIDCYYKVFLDPASKYGKGSKAMEIYNQFTEQYGEPDRAAIERNKAWIKAHIGQIVVEYPEIKLDKNYLKIFFEADMRQFEIESERYYLPNIYNATEYNVTINGQVFGMHNNNLGLNSKKPYLKHRTRKNSTPYLISTEEVILQKKFFDFLMNKVNQGFLNIYIGEEIDCFLADKSMEGSFSGYFLRLQKGKEVEIQDFDTVVHLSDKIEPCYIPESIEIDYTNVKSELIKGRVITKLEDLSQLINNILFNKCLSNNYYQDESKVKPNDAVLKRSILESREAFAAWFYKGNEMMIKPLFPSLSMRIIKNTIFNESCPQDRVKAQEQWMLRQGVINYLNGGGIQVADQMKDKLERIEKKINQDVQQSIDEDIEYAIAVGQLANYLLSLSKAKARKHALVNPILNAKTDEKLKEEIRKFYKRYNYAIEERMSKRFDNLYAMVAAYMPQVINEDALIYGYLTNSLIYKKGEKEDE